MTVTVMADICRYTGRGISNFESTMQGVEIILTTRLRSRVMNRAFGAGLIEFLGRNITRSMLAALQQLIATAIDTWEPRLAVRKVAFTATVEELRAGTLAITIEADYRPGALDDPEDLTVDRSVALYFSNRSGELTLTSDA